jgi:hypothetical protein
MTIEDEPIPTPCNESTYCKSIGGTRAQKIRGLFNSTMRQCRRLFLDQATACRLRAWTHLDGHAVCGRPGREYL